jgi:fluoride exporter
MAIFAQMAWIALGAAIGGPLRFFISGLIGRWIGETFPWGTLAVNVMGSFLIGALWGATGGSAPGWQFAATGFLGAFTTVSSFSLQTLALARDGDLRLAALNSALSLGLCLFACGLGWLACAAR